MNTAVTIAGVTFQNPVMTGSGTFGSGMEYSEFVDLNRLGAVVTKGVANVPWPGNPTPRVLSLIHISEPTRPESYDEVEPERNRHHGDGKSRRGRRRGRDFPD